MEGRKECRNETYKAKVVQQGLYTQMDEKKKEIAGAVKDTVTPKRAVEATI